MYEQAFHTCCRRGLTPQPGFQYNAVSPGLSETVLAQLAAAHAGYQAPRDSPPEPNPDQLSRFPVSLRHLPVDGVGPVVSQTKYVGREFRGHHGEADAGRFGNYFSHIVVGDGSAAPFQELLPIELWDAEHWTTEESATPSLAPIRSLAPGTLDLEGALSSLLPDRAPWIPSIVNATVAALHDGPRVVLVEEAGALAAAWVALMCFALPRALAEGLTFSTFEGRPQYVDMQLTLTTPACDTSFPASELGHRVTVIDAQGPPPKVTREPLLGRAIYALVKSGAEALSVAARVIPLEDPDLLGAEYAVHAGVSELVRDEADVLEIIALLESWHASGRGEGSLGATARELADGRVAPTNATLVAWSALHAEARRGVHPESAEIVDAALAYLLTNLDDLAPLEQADRLLSVTGETSVQPSIARLAEFLEAITESVDPDRLAGRVTGGWRLGLLGINDELDRRFVEVLPDLLDIPIVERIFGEIRSYPASHELVAGVASALVASASSDARALDRLTALADDEVVDQAITDALRTSDSFDFSVTGVRAQLRGHPERRRAFVANLAALAGTDQQQAEIRTLYGPSGPESAEDHTELLASYGLASRSTPAADIEAAWRAVHAHPLADQHTRSEVAALVEMLASTDPHATSHGGYVAWAAVDNQPRARSGPRLSEWMQAVIDVASLPQDQLPDGRYVEFIEIAAGLVLAERDPQEHRACFSVAAEKVSDRVWLEACEAELARQRSELADTVARLFEIWRSPPGSDRAGHTLVLERLLPAVHLTGRQREKIAKTLPKRLEKSWLRWGKEHPSGGGVARAVGRLRRR